MILYLSRFGHPPSAFAARWCAVALLVAATAASLFAGDSAPEMVQNASRAKNLARLNLGAQIETASSGFKAEKIVLTDQPSANAAALLSDDETLSYSLPEGETTFVVSLGKSALLDRFSFINENATARGEMTIAVSNYRLPAGSKKWTEVEGGVRFSGKRLLNFSMLGVEAKYVRLAFRVEKAGRIAGFGLYGPESIDAFAERGSQVRPVANPSGYAKGVDVVNFNFANLYAKSHVVYVSSGGIRDADRMIDDDPSTGFTFAANDPNPTAIIRLGSAEELQRVSALIGAESAAVDIYLLDELPKRPGDLSGFQPVASLQAIGDAEKLAVNFRAASAHYVALRWHRAPSIAGSGEAPEFSVMEVNAFGQVPLATVQNNLELTSGALFASNDSAGLAANRSVSQIDHFPATAAPPVLDVVTP